MPDTDEQTAICNSCEVEMDISALEPFTMVECPSCHAQMRVKDKFGPYILTRRHAIGGMSLVFVAEDCTLNREVIVKILSKEYSSNETRIAAFEEEARITASFNHPNVVRVFTTGRAFDRFFIAMELMPGGHLEHHIRERKKIPEIEALDLAIDVAEGLKAAKRAGLIHRDVKPGNILLDSKGRATLVDFGLALVTKDGFARASEIWATPYYVPPETIEGGEEDFRSDIYAFGATFYHVLSGQPPCNEESMNTKRLREAKQQIRPLAQLAPELSPTTCKTIDRCMAFRPEDRFRSYRDLLSELKNARTEAKQSDGTPVHPASSKPTQQFPKNKKNLVIASAIVGLIVVIIAAMQWSSNDRDHTPPSSIASTNSRNSTAPLPQGGNASRGNAIGSIYQQAKSALGRRSYRHAEKKFAEVRDHPNVLEPTGSWAACEAVAAAYFDARPDDARTQAKASLEIIEKNRREGKAIPAEIPQLLNGLLQLKPLEETDFLDNSKDYPLLWMLAGLKHWSQGLFDRAEPYFTKVANLKLTQQNTWLAPYTSEAKRYLSDLKKLREHEPADFNLPRKEKNRLIRELNAVRDQLLTNGRAPFAIQQWQIILENEQYQPVNQTQTPQKSQTYSGDDLPNGTQKHFQNAQFRQALVLLKKWKPRKPEIKSKQQAYLNLTWNAEFFLSKLHERIPKNGLYLQLQSRDGRSFSHIGLRDNDQFVFTDQSGKKLFLSPHQLEPDSLILIHRELTKRNPDDYNENMKYHTQALAFDYLSGNRERALEAGKRLSDSDDSFRRRWDEFSSIMHP